MNRVNVMLHIFPSGVGKYELEEYDESRDGKIMSNSREIKVNKVLDGYSMLYNDDVFGNLDMSILGANIIKLFKRNLPTAIIDFGIAYHYELSNGDEDFDIDAAEKIFELDARMLKTRDPHFYYHRTGIIKRAIEYYQDLNNEDEEDDEDYYSMYNIGNDTEEDSDVDDIGDIFSFLEKNSVRNKKTKNKSKSDSYGRSKVFRNAKNPKRSYHRHGVIIADDKDDIKKDEKILKEFLKDFFPGGSSWKKDFREDVLKRWMKMYVLTKRKLKKLERDHRKSSGSKVRIDTDKALDFTRRLFNVQLDHWNDPNK